MSTPLHPALADLDARYADLVAQIQNQQISVDDAVDILAQTVAIDADGREWRIDATGDFVANMPGDEPAPADVTTYADVPAAAPQAPWGIQPPNPTGGGAFGPNGGGGPSAGFVADQDTARDDASEMPRMINLGAKATKEPKARSLASSEPKPIADKILGGGLGAKVRANKRPIIIGVVALVVVLFFASRGGSDEPDSGIPAGSDTTIATMPTDTTPPTDVPAETPAPEAPEAPAAAPTSAEVEQVLSELQSGQRAIVSGLVANPGDEATLAVRTAQYAGYPASGLGFLAGPVAVDETGPISDVSLVDAATQVVYRTGKVRWVRAEAGHWQIVDHIDLVPPAG